MKEVELTPTGRTRALPPDVLGLNAPVPYVIPYEDSQLIDVGRFVSPGHLRFPGGSVANFFDWRSGHVDVPVIEDESMYRTFMRNASDRLKPMHPGGAHADAFAKVADAIGASMVWVANLETSTPGEQAAWAADMKAKRVLPSRVELGNEFYIALLNDPASLERFPDFDTTLDLMRGYVDAMRPSLDETNRIAVQAASARWRDAVPVDPRGLHARAVAWDDALRAEDWFHAVTVHPYPEIDHVCGPGTSASLPGSMASTLPALLARVDAGTDRVLNDVADRVPGKELWVTEWGAGEIAATLQGRRPVFNGMWLIVEVRHALAQLRHPAVTLSSHHAFFFDGGVSAVARRVAGGYEPMGSASWLQWLNHAANGGAVHEEVDAAGTTRVVVGRESYAEVEAALFRRDDTTTLLVQNASAEPVRIRLHSLGLGDPGTVECMVADDLAESYGETLPREASLPAQTTVELPPWSLGRSTW